MRNALHTAVSSPDFKNLHIHINDCNSSIIARNILITHIITSPDFKPNNQTELDYVWDVWYSTQWDDATKTRFIKDVDEMLAHQWKKNIVIKDEDLSVLDVVWKYWKTHACSMNPHTFFSIMKQR